ncbi:MAG: hypothetical protein GY814_11350 [Gammaproteobacteria bacterium]|nr:hypothetical protein [Gammaproteobacteria bacterium]
MRSRQAKSTVNSRIAQGQVSQEEPVVFYCNAEKCDRSSWGAALALEWGWKKIYYFRDGFPAWSKAGLPLR